MIGKSQFKLLSYLIYNSNQNVSVSALADRLDWSIGHTSRVISDLETLGCVHRRERGDQKRVVLADIEPVEQLKALVTEYRHVDFAELIAGSGFQVLYYLDQPRTATELTEASGISRATVYRRLKKLQRVGIVGKSQSHYELNQPFSSLSSIVRGFSHHGHRHEAEQHADRVSFHWETHDEYLFVCELEFTADSFHLTGPALFAEFDIPLMTRQRWHYLRSDRISTVSPAELICHMLLIDDTSRYRIYALLLMKKEAIAPETLRARADYYNPEADIDVRAVVDDLVEYLETEGSVVSDRLPTWEDFKRTAADYEIKT